MERPWTGARWWRRTKRSSGALGCGDDDCPTRSEPGGPRRFAETRPAHRPSGQEEPHDLMLYCRPCVGPELEVRRQQPADAAQPPCSHDLERDRTLGEAFFAGGLQDAGTDGGQAQGPVIECHLPSSTKDVSPVRVTCVS